MIDTESQLEELQQQMAAVMSPQKMPRTLEDEIIEQMEMELREELGVFSKKARPRPATTKAKRRQRRRAKRLSKLPYTPRMPVPTGNSKSYHDWIVLHALETPGPDVYDNRYPMDSDVLPSMNLFGKFSEHKNPSALDVLCLAKSREPGPMDYKPNFDHKLPRPSSACFTEGKVPTIDDLIQQQAAIFPGPGQYANAFPPYSPVGSAKFSLATATSPVDIAVKRASMTPGPGQYDVISSERSLSPIRGGRFAKSFLRSPDCGKSRGARPISTRSEGRGMRQERKNSARFSAAKQRRAIDVTYDDASTLTTALSPTSIATEPAFFR